MDVSNPCPIGFALIIAGRDASVIATKRDGGSAQRDNESVGRKTSNDDTWRSLGPSIRRSFKRGAGASWGS